MRILRELSAELFVMAAIGLVLGLLGPFGTFAVPAGIRLPAWILLAIGGYACFRPVLAAGLSLSARTGLPRLAAQAIACVLAAMPTSVLAGLLFARLRLGPPGLDAMVAMYPQVLLVGVIATAVQLALFARTPATADPVPAAAVSIAVPPPIPPEEPRADAPAPAVPHAVPPAPAFLDRLPPAHRHDLLCLEMEDHYVRAHTPSGSTLVLIRMRDAAAELAGIEGLRVHRSWWVARAAVAEVIRRDRAILLRLVNGIEVPVARNVAPALRAAGWL